MTGVWSQMENIQLLIRMLVCATCLICLLCVNPMLGRCLMELEELYAAFDKQTYGEDHQDDSKHLHGARESDKFGCLSVKALCKLLLRLYNPKKFVHLLRFMLRNDYAQQPQQVSQPSQRAGRIGRILAEPSAPCPSKYHRLQAS